MKMRGMTLAEVLVTLGILGVITALVIPVFKQSFNNNIFEKNIFQVYSNVNTAINSYMNANGIKSLEELEFDKNNQAFKDFIFENFKITKECNSSGKVAIVDGGEETVYGAIGQGCFADKYTSFNKKATLTVTGRTCDFAGTLTNGAAVCFSITPPGLYSGYKDLVDKIKKGEINPEYYDTADYLAEHNSLPSGVAFAIEVDTNGPKQPNISGRDYFTIYVSDTGTVYGDTHFDVYSAEAVGIGKLMQANWNMKKMEQELNKK